MRLKIKIFFGFFVMALVFSGGVLVCLKTLGPIERTFERHTVENMPILNAIQNVRTQGSILHAELLELSYLLHLDATDESQRALEAERSEIAETREQLLAGMQEYRKLVELYFPEESSYIPLLQGQIDQHLAMIDELERLTPGESGVFSMDRKNHFEALEQGFLALTDEMVSFETREVQVRREAVNAAVASARRWIVASAGVSLLLALVLTLLLTGLSSTSEPTGGRRVRRHPRRRAPRH